MEKMLDSFENKNEKVELKDENNEDIVVLNHLQNDKHYTDEEYFQTHVWKVVRKRGYHINEIRKKVQIKTPEEIIKEKEVIKNISTKLYYDIQKEKINEIEKTFRSKKLKFMLKDIKKL